MMSFSALCGFLLPTAMLIGTAMPAVAQNDSDEEKIRSVVTKSYFDGAFNSLNVDEMRKGFHPDFAILGADKESVDRYTIEQWASAIEQRKAKPDFSIDAAKRDCRIISVDSSGGAAAVKVEISKNGKLQYTDYLSLLKFDSGWRIVSKVYFEHPSP
jgi:hypothetical protein